MLEWADPQTFDHLQTATVAQYSSPVSVHFVTESGEERTATIGSDGVARFAPVTAHRIDVTFPAVARFVVKDRNGNLVDRPLALASLFVPDTPGAGTTPDDVKVTVPCGSGPTITIDGRSFDTAVDSALGTVSSLRTVPARLCGSGTIDLDAGSHTLDTARSDASPFVVASVTLPPADLTPSTTPARDLEVESWGAEHRSVRIGSGGESYVVVSENANPGWKATLDGVALHPVTIDGWQQGFVVPAGEGGLVELTYAPARTFRFALVIGGLMIAALLALLVLPRRKVDQPPLGEGRPALWLLVAMTVVVGLALGGPLVLLAVPVVLLGRWRPTWLPVIAGGCFALAALVVALTQGWRSHNLWGTTGHLGTILTVVAVLAVAVTLLLPALGPESNASETADTAPEGGIVAEGPPETRTGAAG